MYCSDEGVGLGQALHRRAGVPGPAHHLSYEAATLQGFTHHLWRQKQACTTEHSVHFQMRASEGLLPEQFGEEWRAGEGHE